MGNQPLEQNHEWIPLNNWMDNHNFNTLFDISSWLAHRGCWMGWLINLSPYYIILPISILFDSLKVYAPWYISTSRHNVWGASYYNVKRG